MMMTSYICNVCGKRAEDQEDIPIGWFTRYRQLVDDKHMVIADGTKHLCAACGSRYIAAIESHGKMVSMEGSH